MAVGFLRRGRSSNAEYHAFGIQHAVFDRPLQETVNIVELAGIEFIVKNVSARIVPHAMEPPHPPFGRSACWAEQGQGQIIIPWRTGVLTCKHVVTAFGLGARVPLSLGNTAGRPIPSIVADWTSDTIDAAVLAVGAPDFPKGLNPLRVVAQPVGSMRARFVNAQGRTIHARITLAEGPPGYYGNQASHRVYMDNFGSDGDSGALISENPGGDGLALYMGTVLFDDGRVEGQGQSLYQAMRYFNAIPMA